MSTKKIIGKTNQLADKLPDEKVTHSQVDTKKASDNKKPFHQFFSLQLFVIFLAFSVVVLTSLWLLSQQFKFSQALITEQVTPLKGQLLQQTYLINSNNIIDALLHSENINDINVLQKSLALQSKKLSLLASSYKTVYQQWFTVNDNDTKTIITIAKNNPEHELLKSKVLIQLDTLLDAIKIELNKARLSSKQVTLLNKLENQLSNIVTAISSLNLKTSFTVMDSLSKQVNTLFVDDYAKQLATKQSTNQNMADIVRDLIRFEDLILKQGLLVKWQTKLGLIANFQTNLISQQQALQKTLLALVENNLHHDKDSARDVALNDAVFNVASLQDIANIVPRRILVIYALILYFTLILLLWVRIRLKAANKTNINLIGRAIQTRKRSILTEGSNALIEDEKSKFYSAESAALIRKIEADNRGDYNKINYLELSDKHKATKEKLVKANEKIEELTEELNQFELDVSAMSERALLLEHQRCSELQKTVINQLVLMSCTVNASPFSHQNKNNTPENNNFFKAYLQGIQLEKQLSQARYHLYLQSEKAILTLSDVNIAAEIQAVLLNTYATMQEAGNQITLEIDEKIQVGVNVDVELFSEIFRTFIDLLLMEQSNKQVSIALKLVDKNNGQQKVVFIGEVKSNDKSIKLPKSLAGFNTETESLSELASYFSTLLDYQYGEDIDAKLTAKAYQCCFKVPLAVINDQPEESYPKLSLPFKLPELEQECSALKSKYLAMPIAVLLAVKRPEKHYHLQQILQSLGLQTKFVTNEFMLQAQWISGQFSVLITDLNCQTFTPFIIDEQQKPDDISKLVKGVFTLVDSTGKNQEVSKQNESKDPLYSHWFTGQINSGGNTDKLIAAMLPWINKQGDSSEQSRQISEKIIDEKKGVFMDDAQIDSVNQTSSFDFNRYLKHQGSTELAIFMLDEYITENKDLTGQLQQAFANNDTQQTDTTIQSLVDNSRILAAGHLLSLCEHLQALLAKQGLNNTDNEQINLLTKIDKAVEVISQDADSIV
ncbi:hypothetical protein [Colwellia sp. E2M01]|uniref:hypothetical protein n=1 Tax=Colwellia sp. E2M01 TaxID=2841561 RepID=UPI001C091697|nr:hypothetical protein [Colwellia sp. E2M01]MBU2871209.1 hypothetical protein [Colwellia sp. E2M01]